MVMNLDKPDTFFCQSLPSPTEGRGSTAGRFSSPPFMGGAGGGRSKRAPNMTTLTTLKIDK